MKLQSLLPFLSLIKSQNEVDSDEVFTSIAGAYLDKLNRNFNDVRNMMHMLVCRRAGKCGFDHDDFFLALKDYGCKVSSIVLRF